MSGWKKGGNVDEVTDEKFSPIGSRAIRSVWTLFNVSISKNFI